MPNRPAGETVHHSVLVRAARETVRLSREWIRKSLKPGAESQEMRIRRLHALKERCGATPEYRRTLLFEVSGGGAVAFRKFDLFGYGVKGKR